MKALSLIQPWATLVAIGAKTVETRAWATGYRGPLAIHASKWLTATGKIVSADVAEYLALCHDEPFRTALTRAGLERVRDLPSGAIVATARLVEVVPTLDALGRVDDYELEFGNFRPGRFAWFLRDVQALAMPVPYRGEPGLWELPASALVQTSARPLTGGAQEEGGGA